MKNLLSTLPNSSQGFFLSNTEIVHNVAVIHIKLGRFCACRRGKCCTNVGKIERGKPRCQDRAGRGQPDLQDGQSLGGSLGGTSCHRPERDWQGVCAGGGGVFGGAVVDIRRRATMNNASKEAGRCSASWAGAGRGNHEQKGRAIWTVSSAADHRRG